MMENKYVTTGQVAGGGVLVWISNLDLASWSYIVGIGVAIVGLVGGSYWQWKKDKRDQAIMMATLEALKTRGVVIHDEHLG